QLGGDITYICRDGLQTIARYLQSARVDATTALTDKISKLISDLIALYANNIGWEVFLFPDGNQLWLNVPGDAASAQYSMSTLNGSWAEFVGMNALSFCLFNNRPLFGTRDGKVCRGWEGYLDNVNDISTPPLIGSPIATEVI